MAISLGVFSNVYKVHTVSSVDSSSAASSQLVPANLRAVCTVTVAAASKPATETKKREPRGIMKPRRISPEMQAFLGGGVTEIPRTQALKEIWAYIKQYNLQAARSTFYLKQAQERMVGRNTQLKEVEFNGFREKGRNGERIRKKLQGQAISENVETIIF